MLQRIPERIRAAWSAIPAALWTLVVPALVLPSAGWLALNLSEHAGIPAARVAGFGALLLAIGGALGILFLTYHRQQSDFEALEAFTRRLLSTLDVRELTRLVTREAGKLIGADGVAISRVGDGGVLVVSSASSGPFSSVAGLPLPLDGSLAGWCVQTGRCLAVRDARRDPRRFQESVAAGAIHRMLAAPLEVGGERFGAILASRSGEGAPRFRARELRVWETLAQRAGLALSNARLYERATARRQRFEELHTFAAAMMGTLDRQKVFDAVTERAARTLGADAASFVLSDRPDVVYESRYGPEHYAPGFRLLADETLAGTVVREGRTVRISDISQDARYNPKRIETPTQAVLAVPVLVDGVPVGSLGVLQYAARDFTDDDEELLCQLAAIAASVLRAAATLDAVRRAHERFLTLFQAMPEGALLIARDGTIELANPAAERLFAVPPEGLAGTALAGFVADADRLQRWLFDWCENDTPRSGRLVRADREVREVEWRVNRLEEGNDEQVICAVRDLTDELKQTAEQRTLAAAVGAMRDGVFLVDTEGTIQFANTAAVRMLGYETDAALVGKAMDLLVPEERSVAVATGLPAMLSEDWTGEGLARHASGRAIPVQAAIAPVREGDRTVGLVGLVVDLTERRSLEQRAAVSEKLATLGRLVAGAAHEINNPLTAILANAQFALEAAPAGQPAHDALAVIAAEARRAGQIVKGMLSFARQRPVAQRSLELRELADEVLRLRRGYHQSLGIAVTVTGGREGAPVHADPDQMKQVLLNLVVNAEYALRGSEARRLRLTVGRTGGSCRLSVEDSGPGVPAAVRGQIFEPFFTTKPEGEGSGLGLSVSYGIVHEHGGQIWVEDSALGGACFVIELPVAQATQGPPPPPATSAAEAPPGPPASRRVLLVDDEETIRSAAQRILRRYGHEVDVAADGSAALVLLEAMRYDVVLCDIRMPNLSGPELYGELRRRGMAHDSHFVVTTGDIADPDTQQFLSDSRLPVLLKPFELKSLLAVVER